MLPDFLPDSTNKLGYVKEPAAESSTQQTATQNLHQNGDGSMRAPGGHQAQGEEEQLLYMNNERFVIPEVLFNPSTIGER